jgi:transcriptional regulator with PAS, ATPase and Fis domain
MQTKLLRVLDEKEITPLGSRSSKKVDFRLIAASNKSLENMVRENKFRLDLFYRLNIMHIELPPLREIKGSIEAICHHIVDKKCKEMGHNTVKISSEVIKLFREYDWPGNVRELTNLIENAINICDGKLIILSDLPKNFLRNFDKSPKMGLNKKLAGLIQECEEQAIQEALRVTGNNKRQAAKILGIHRSWLYQKINEHSAPSVRALKIFDIAQVTPTKALQFRHAVLGPG